MKDSMRRLAFSLLCGLALLAIAPDSARAQGADGLYIGSQRAPIHVRATAVYERYEDDHASLSQLSLPVAVSLPLARNLGLTVQSQYVTTEGDSLAAVSGPADTQLGLSYFTPLGPGSAVVTLGANLPSGQRELAVAEAETAFLVGQAFYGFSLPTLGQGLSVAPGITYALPVGDRLALGLGLSYQYRAPFRPRADVEGDYDPGDELLVTGGLDYRVSPTSTLSLDLTYASIATDTWGDFTYDAGNAVAATAQVRTRWGRHDVHLLGRYRSRGTDERAVAVGFGADSAIPAQGRAFADVRFRLTERLLMGVLVQGRHYAASDYFPDSKVIADVGLRPEVRLTPQLALVGRARLSAGDVSGFALGGGIAWTR